MLAKLTDDLQRPPTLSELAEHLQIARQNARNHIWRLKEKGFVHFKAQDRQALTPVLTDKAKVLLEHPGYAVLGSIAAGQPIYAEGNIESFTQNLADLFPIQAGDYLLKVVGDSMIGAGYFEDDYVIVHATKDIYDGDIVVAFLPNEESATLKRFYRKQGKALLVAENPAYEPIELPLSQVAIQGVVIGHLGYRRKRKALKDVFS
ncbi:MAG: transcriptional repressor LexA [Trueperaceae bacterium]|nr:transcriptional repressor LexA [Trueperaceae bacterium]